MTAHTADNSLLNHSVGDLAATIPGATAVFREHRIDFCCGGEAPLAEAAERFGADAKVVDEKLQELAANTDGAVAASSMSSEDLIDHIVNHYHASHRRTIPELVALSRKVEQVHSAHPKVPAGLADLLSKMQAEMDEHMGKEEAVMFPAMRRQAAGSQNEGIGELRHEHDDQGEILHEMEHLTDMFAVPPEACSSWKALYMQTGQLVEDVMQHIHLENNVLFPRFTAAA